MLHLWKFKIMKLNITKTYKNLLIGSYKKDDIHLIIYIIYVIFN